MNTSPVTERASSAVSYQVSPLNSTDSMMQTSQAFNQLLTSY